MSNPLAGIDTDRWYLLVIVASIIGLIASIAAHERTYVAAAFGCLLFGIGEVINHPYQEKLGWDAGQRFKVSGRPRSNKRGGVAMSGLGILIAGIAILRSAFGI